MKYIKLFDNFDFNEDDFDWDEESGEWVKAHNSLKVGDRVMMDRDSGEYLSEGKDSDGNDISGTIMDIREGYVIPYKVLWDGMSDKISNYFGYSSRHLLYQV